MRALRMILAASVLLVGVTVCSARPWGYYRAPVYSYGAYYAPRTLHTVRTTHPRTLRRPVLRRYRYPGYYSSYYAPNYGYATPYDELLYGVLRPDILLWLVVGRRRRAKSH